MEGIMRLWMVFALGVFLVGAMPVSAGWQSHEGGQCCATKSVVNDHAPGTGDCPEGCACDGLCAACPCCSHGPVAILLPPAAPAVSLLSAATHAPLDRRAGTIPLRPEVPPPRHAP
jgi:hypothetical protein